MTEALRIYKTTISTGGSSSLDPPIHISRLASGAAPLLLSEQTDLKACSG